MQAQELSLNYHCKCEQWVHFGTGSFFNFNGTAGVWRKKCVDSIGGWNSRTTVSFSPVQCELQLQQTRVVELVCALIVSGVVHSSCQESVCCDAHTVSFESTCHFSAGPVQRHWWRPHVMRCCGQVEDMDLSLRSYVGGWRAIFLEDTTCLNEVPPPPPPPPGYVRYLSWLHSDTVCVSLEAVQQWGCAIIGN